ncbi:MAG: alpha-L-glutamate ligase-like protein [Pseudomonadota bacterium]
MLRTFLSLRKSGVIGINERNLSFINPTNDRRDLIKVNDKLQTKTLAERAGIPCPELYGVIANSWDMRGLKDYVSRPEGCVIKPALGSQGKGIMVINGPLNDGWQLSSGRLVDEQTIRFHVNNIISGMYSLGGQVDKALIEYRVKFDTIFEKISFKGVPDIRVIVLSGVPVFAMIRLPTAASDGKANLHRGGVGVGLSIATGITELGMQHDRPIDQHPDTGQSLSGVQVPHWDEILLMAAQSYDVTGLGYIGVDIVLDRDLGPLLLELNGRPGLSIQIANRGGLRRHLEAVRALRAGELPVAKRVDLAKRVYADLKTKAAA